MNPLVFLLLPCFLLLAGCDLNFGNDEKKSGGKFDAATMVKVAKLTGMSFPPGSKGLEYFYKGSGIDDSLAAKIEIPPGGRKKFLENDIFVKGTDEKAAIEIGKAKKWWKLSSLKDRIDRKMDLAPGRHLEVTFGKEGKTDVVYVSWFTS